MLQLNFIREHKEEVITRLAVKNFDANTVIDEILEADIHVRKLKKELEDFNSYANKLVKEIGTLFRTATGEEIKSKKEENSAIKQKVKIISDNLSHRGKQLDNLLLRIPNLPHSSVPKGKTPADNEIIFSEGEIPKLPSSAKPHWELAQQYNLIDFELGVKLTGAGFPVYKGKGAKLQRALINFFTDKVSKTGGI